MDISILNNSLKYKEYEYLSLKQELTSLKENVEKMLEARKEFEEVVYKQAERRDKEIKDLIEENTRLDKQNCELSNRLNSEMVHAMKGVNTPSKENPTYLESLLRENINVLNRTKEEIALRVETERLRDVETKNRILGNKVVSLETLKRKMIKDARRMKDGLRLKLNLMTLEVERLKVKYYFLENQRKTDLELLVNLSKENEKLIKEIRQLGTFKKEN